MRKNSQEFSVWPLMIDMLTSILIVFILVNFFNNILNPRELEQVVVDIKREQFSIQFDHRFADEIRNKVISREGKFDYLKITFSDRVLFESGEHQLKINGRRMLEKLSPLLKQENTKRDIARIQVEGHTDATPMEKGKITYPRDNWELSTARALSVVDYFSNMRLNLKFSANGYGSTEPVSEQLEMNRRIEIKIYFQAK